MNYHQQFMYLPKQCIQLKQFFFFFWETVEIRVDFSPCVRLSSRPCIFQLWSIPTHSHLLEWQTMQSRAEQ